MAYDEDGGDGLKEQKKGGNVPWAKAADDAKDDSLYDVDKEIGDLTPICTEVPYPFNCSEMELKTPAMAAVEGFSVSVAILFA